ncbi:MAG TPA: sigma-70 family RNA polymerase sigma factor [Terriglobia bacterium]|jgi:RNA polymerase sigma factor (sigma-70 family)|nr:sigma-70 family RNA polymerase sigma factor [Terriglobia bacterium]
MATLEKDDPEVEWIRRTQQGDGDAYALLVSRYERRVFSLVYRIMRRHEEVEEIAQEIFIKAFLAVGNYHFEAAFGTWLMRIAINHCYDQLRRRRSSRVTYFSEMSADGEQAVVLSAESREGGRIQVELEGRDLAGKLLERASPEDRMILTLKEIEDLSVDEISRLLKLKASTVKVRLHRARKRMLADFRRWQEGK